MFRNPFDGARAKIERSHRHFDELVAEEAAYMQPEKIIIDLVRQPNGDTKGYGRLSSIPTLQHCAIVADILGAFRSSLDIAVYEAARSLAKNEIGKIYFAFGKDEAGWNKVVRQNMRGVDSRVCDVVRRFRPWTENGNVVLAALNPLVNADKHVQLVGLAGGPSEMSIDGLSLHRDDGKACHYMGKVPVWTDANPTEIFTVGAPATVEITGDCTITPRFGFGAVHGLPLVSAVAILNEMGSICEKVIDAMEEAVR
ncbi:hypothetical protein [Sphingomonas sp. CFBP 13706]|uniref:hypothetical protein n=1 Tax=Sphingomonas sp. CFBP 13706 TaxID=2775314 RepID=UPI001785EA3C|nr:hypothetical protein [Sphingomonas sp. CFBP 13706]MBD8734909.1 hypothetical protein [Sphingomonas sp. CFBP 13706]